MIKPRFLWAAHYFFADGGCVDFAVVAATSGDVAEMLSKELDPYRFRDIVAVKIIRATGDFCKINET